MKEMQLPKKHKDQILKYCKELEALSRDRVITVTVPVKKIKINVRWTSDTTLDIDDSFLTIDDLNKCKEIKAANKKIKAFCKKVDRWSKKHYKDKEWLWLNVFWCYNTNTETFEEFEKKTVHWV